ncbi:MAG: DNA-binding protein WhiA [Clostridia bacterium]|nr:DNA-binding protein WhiA [Clostridia bacterium]
MSFAKDTKLQILKKPLKNDCCGLAFLSGLLHSSGEFDITNKTMSVVTDIPELGEFCNKIIMQLYGDVAKVSIDEHLKINNKTYYRITFPQKNLNEMMKDFELIDAVGTFNGQKINNHLIQEICCKKSFIKGVFLGCATSGISFNDKRNKKINTGYNVEFVSHSQSFLMQFSDLLAEFNLFPKIIKRKNHYVLYLKEASSVCDLLAIIEAFDSVLLLQGELVVRELRNKVNRQTNCVSGNIGKMVNASIRQLEAIDIISDTIGLSALPFDLHEISLLRLANPEESLNDLLKLSTLKLSKSTLNYKLNKIIKIADDLSKLQE